MCAAVCRESRRRILAEQGLQGLSASLEVLSLVVEGPTRRIAQALPLAEQPCEPASLYQ